MTRILLRLTWRHIAVCGIVGGSLAIVLALAALGERVNDCFGRLAGIPETRFSHPPFGHIDPSVWLTPVRDFGVRDWLGVGLATARNAVLFSGLAVMVAMVVLSLGPPNNGQPDIPANSKARLGCLVEVGCALVLAVGLALAAGVPRNELALVVGCGWPILALLGLWPFVVVWRWWLERKHPETCSRFPPGFCWRCGYDLRPTQSASCPECGAPAKCG